MTASLTSIERLKADVPASIVVFLVAVPLCMGIAIASGAPPAAGLLTGIVGGLVVGWFAGSPLQVSGPAAGLAVIVWGLIQTHGMAKLGVIIVMAGLIQILAGVLQLGQWFRAVSPAVIHGMLSGIGALIFASQFHVMVDDTPKGSGIRNILTIPEAIWKGIWPWTGSDHHWAALTGLVTILLIAGWKSFTPSKWQVIPAPLVGVVGGTGLSLGLALPINRVSVPDNLLEAVHGPAWADFLALVDVSTMAMALAVAAVASIETLLCATAVDQMHTGPRTQYSRELTSQGVGNVLCGFLGALPMTGVIVRSSANVQAGARTRTSTILHGFWLLLFVAFLSNVLAWIPTSSLAALLVFTGYKLVNVQVVHELKRYGRGEVLIYGATLGGIVLTNLLTGVLIGVGLALAKLVYKTQHLELSARDHDDANVTVIELAGLATFVNLPKLAATLEQIRPGTKVHVRSSDLQYIDHSCLNLLRSWKTLHEQQGGRVIAHWQGMESLCSRPRSWKGGPSLVKRVG